MSPNTEKMTFDFKSIVFPRIHCVVLSTTKNQVINHGFKMNVTVVDDHSVQVYFGIQLLSADKVHEKESVTCRIDTLAEFKTHFSIPKGVAIADIPMLGNMMAALFPFIREKVHYCLAGAGIHLILPPLNVADLLNQNTSVFGLEDLRSKEIEKTSESIQKL